MCGSVLIYQNLPEILLPWGLPEYLKQVGITEDYVEIWGSGEIYKEFLYVDDLAEACIFLMERYDYKDIGEIINIGTGEDIKVKDLALLIKNVVGFEGEMKYDLSKTGGTPSKLLNISRIKKLGWEAKNNLEEGLRRTYDWYNKQVN